MDKGDRIFDQNVEINGNLTVQGTFCTVNTATRIITTTEYNPIERDVELSKFILEKIKKYDSDIEYLKQMVESQQETISVILNDSNSSDY